MARKKKTNWLKIFRVAFAAVVFAIISLYLLDFTNLLPDSFRSLITIQFVPAILAGFTIAWLVIILATVVFGRLYCSVLCPAGILQDIIVRFSRFFQRKSGKKKIFFHYQKPYNIIRYGILALTVILFILGSIHLLLYLDPYSNFGRIAANLFRPVVIGANNVAAKGLMQMDQYWLYDVNLNTISIGSLIAAIVAFVTLIIMSVLHGRLFCNTLCPVGSTLSVFSKYSLFKIDMDETLCNACGNCTRACKAECIDYENMKVDNSRCVTCFNCITHCNRGGLHYRFVNPFKKKQSIFTAEPVTEAAKSNAKGRRLFVSALGTLAASIPVAKTLAQEHRGHGHDSDHYRTVEIEGKEGVKHITIKGEGGPSVKHHKQNRPITPPGSLSYERFIDKCTACGLCVIKCPTQILKPVGFTYGFDYILKPEMYYDNDFCNYECTICADVCPNDALTKLTQLEKETTQMGIVHFNEDLCVVKTDNTDCGACSEHCPTQAVKMVPYKGALTIPQINEDLCIGCGGCEYICPTRPKRAIFIVANEVHKKVEKPKEEKVKEVENLDFGF